MYPQSTEEWNAHARSLRGSFFLTVVIMTYMYLTFHYLITLTRKKLSNSYDRMERNDVLFKGKVVNILEGTIDRIKRLPRSWFIYEERRNKKIVFSRIGGWTQLYVFKACNFLTYCIGFQVSLILCFSKILLIKKLPYSLKHTKNNNCPKLKILSKK